MSSSLSSTTPQFRQYYYFYFCIIDAITIDDITVANNWNTINVINTSTTFTTVTVTDYIIIIIIDSTANDNPFKRSSYLSSLRFSVLVDRSDIVSSRLPGGSGSERGRERERGSGTSEVVTETGCRAEKRRRGGDESESKSKFFEKERATSRTPLNVLAITVFRSDFKSAPSACPYRVHVSRVSRFLFARDRFAQGKLIRVRTRERKRKKDRGRERERESGRCYHNS